MRLDFVLIMLYNILGSLEVFELLISLAIVILLSL